MDVPACPPIRVLTNIVLMAGNEGGKAPAAPVPAATLVVVCLGFLEKPLDTVSCRELVIGRDVTATAFAV